MQLKKDLLKVLNTKVINLLIVIITGFLIPAFISINEYALLQTFLLYVSYVGILHLGFIDGIFIKYGGKHEDQIDTKILKGEHHFFLAFQLITTFLFLLVGIIIEDFTLIAVSLVIIPLNIQTFFQFIYQALGDFKKYSKIILYSSYLLFIINLFFVFILKAKNHWIYILGNILIYYIIFLGLELHFFKKYKGIQAVIEKKKIVLNFKIGIFIMIGNLSFMFFYSADRWLVKYFLSVNDFSFYSFAISMMMVINVLIGSVTLTFYPYLARGFEEKTIKIIKKYLLIIGTLSSGAYFGFAGILYYFLPKYIPSLKIISILFAGYPVIIIINALYINLYKTRREEKKYLYTVLKMALICLGMNLVSVAIYKSSISIAVATTISFYVWYIYSSRHFSFLKITYKETIYLMIYALIFLISSNYLNLLYGTIFFCFGISLLIFSFYKNETSMLIRRLFRNNF
ncbi:lipopolysaccharide biosynthesis protein [Neobacillus terrae]|uniref:lipopolysaccharide biosynthesis protein n=1 Tax=Neobacillus terrae TaxID=3034837 RepID=UPI00140960F3|nr:lipopolysaccharide biosynthesis protein [Neobacillus terrae]NHM30009.1 lipopolysaccharide biosynthesis protein [Neobacillus terrae]